MRNLYNRLSWAERLFYLVAILTVIVIGGAKTASAVRLSGPGQTTMARSLSVALASDQSDVVHEVQPSKMHAITPSDSTDTSAYCNDYVYVGGTGDAGLSLLGVDDTYSVNDAGVTDGGLALTGVTAGTKIQGKFARIKAAGTSVTGIVCFGH